MSDEDKSNEDKDVFHQIKDGLTESIQFSKNEIELKTTEMSDEDNCVVTHDILLSLVVHKETDFEPYGKRERDGSDCSCGCKWFATLDGKLGYDWGVCGNKNSPRAGLLTFEHQGCRHFNE